MTSRREFFQLSTRTAIAAMLASNRGVAMEQNDAQRANLRRGLPLLDLQQRFVDLRFGMFLHFNMATFQDREWGDPTSSDGDFHSSWYLEEGQISGWLEVDLQKRESFNVVSLVEPVGDGDDYLVSRIQSYRFECWNDMNWTTLANGEKPTPTTIHRIPRVSSQRLRLVLESSKPMPHIAEIGVYNEPG